MIDYMKVQSNGNNFLLLDNRPLLHASDMLSQLAIRDRKSTRLNSSH